ncbi:MAG: DUF4287 domain-containing protein [Anaerolineae bacterium]
MTFQAYLDTIKEKTGKSPDDFVKLAKKKGLTQHAELLAWLKEEFGLGTGHARALIVVIQGADKPRASKDEAVDKHFTGAKAGWRTAYDALLKKLNTFGSDVSVSPTSSYISLLRDKKKFGIVQVSSKYMDIGIKRKGTPATDRFGESGSWNNMVTHRVRIEDPKELNAELYKWLRAAYDSA